MKKVMIGVMFCALAVGIVGCQCPFKCMGKCDGTKKTEECDKAQKVCEGCGKAMAECACKPAE